MKTLSSTRFFRRDVQGPPSGRRPRSSLLKLLDCKLQYFSSFRRKTAKNRKRSPNCFRLDVSGFGTPTPSRRSDRQKTPRRPVAFGVSVQNQIDAQPSFAETLRPKSRKNLPPKDSGVSLPSPDHGGKKTKIHIGVRRS